MALPFDNNNSGLRLNYINPLEDTRGQGSYSNPLLANNEVIASSPIRSNALDPEIGPFEAGVRRGALGVEAGLRGFTANLADTFNAPEFAKSQLKEINNAVARMPQTNYATRLEDVKDASGLYNFAVGSTGQALPTMLTAVAGGIAGRLGASRLGMSPGAGTFTGAATGVFPQEAGEAAVSMYNDPYVMANTTPAQRTLNMIGKGAVGSALEAIPEAMFVGKLAKGVAPAAARGFAPGARYIGGEALKAGLGEAATEAAQEVSGQMFKRTVNPNEDLLPSGMDLLNAAAQGFLPGSVMGGIGGTAALARTAATGRTEEGGPVQERPKFSNLYEVAQNPELSRLVGDLEVPRDVRSQGANAVADWMMQNNYGDRVVQRAREVAADPNAMDVARRNAQAIVDNPGDASLWAPFTGLATAEQKGREAGELLSRLASPTMQSVFGRKKSDPNEKFSAMNVQLTETDKPLVDALSPYLRSAAPDEVAAAVPLIKGYITAFENDSSAKVPAGLMGLFKDKTAQEGIRTAYQTLKQMGEIGNVADADYNGFVDDVIQRQSMFNSLLSDNIPPALQPEFASRNKRNLLISAFESFASEAPSKPEAVDNFVELAREVFGSNYDRALTQMAPLLPQETGSILASRQGQAELSNLAGEATTSENQTADVTDIGSDQVLGQTPAANILADQGFSVTGAPAKDVTWRFSRREGKDAFDTANPAEAQFLANVSAQAARSGNVEPVPTGVAEYARLTGDQVPLKAAQAKAPGLSANELNERFKIVGNYKRGEPEAEQFTYDEVVGKNSPVRSEFAAIKVFEPGAKAAKLVTNPAKLIAAIRAKSQEKVSEDLTDAEAAARDFSRAIASILNVEKDGQPAFDRVTVRTTDKNGKETFVELKDMPDSFTLFQGVTVGDVKAATQQRVGPPSNKRFTDLTPEDMSLAELRQEHAEATQKYKDIVSERKKIVAKMRKDGENSIDLKAAARLESRAAQQKKKVNAVRTEVRKRLNREGLPSTPADVQDALLDEALPSGNELVPNEDATRKSAAPVAVEGAAPATNLASETEEMVTQAPVDRSSPDISPGDIEAAQLGPRVFQEETGLPLHSPQDIRAGVTSSAETRAAKNILDAIKDAPESSIKNTIEKTVTGMFDGTRSPEDLKRALKEAERKAIVEGLMPAERATYSQGKLKQVAYVDRSTVEKMNSMDPLLEDEMTAEDKTAITNWLSKVLPDFTVQFVKELGGMSGSYSKDALGKAIVKINVHSYDPMSVAYHEGVHDLFSTLAKDGQQAVLDMLKRVGSNKIILNKLEKLLEGNKAAIAQLKDPEEAAAYLFQFWMTGQIQVGPQTQSFFEKVMNSVRKFLKLLTDEQQAEQLFQMFTDGSLKDSISRDESLTFLMTPRHKQMMEAAKPLTDFVGKLTFTVDSRFRESNNPHLKEIINLFKAEPGSESQGYFTAVAQARNRQINVFNEALRNHSKEKINEALTEMQLERPLSEIKDAEIKEIVGKTRKILESMHDYLVRKGVQRWDDAQNKFVDIGYVENYFPRVWSLDSLVSKGSEFVEDLVKYHSKELGEIAKNETERQNKESPGSGREISVRELAEAIHAKMIRNMGVADSTLSSVESGLKENEAILGFSPAMNAANERVLPFLKKDVFEKYLEKDVVSIMTRYIQQAVKRAEYTSRFGNTGSKLEQLLEQAEEFEVDKLLSKEYGRTYKTKKEGLLKDATQAKGESREAFLKRTLSGEVEGFAEAYDQAAKKVKPEMDSNRAAVMALEGTLGHDISNGLRKFNSGMLAYQNWRTLPLALLSSIIDPLGIVVRGGTARQAFDGMKRGFKEVVKSWKGDFTGAEDPDVKMAELLGVLEPSSFIDSFGQAYGSMFMTGTARKANDILFRINGMEAWNRAMRTQAAIAAIEFIKELKTRPAKDSERFMKELGLTLDDIVIKEDGSLDLSNKDKKLQSAIMQWVDGAILRPDASQRPAWASNPKFALIFHLSQYTYSFQKVILQRMYNEAKNGNYDPLMVAAAGYVPIMIAAGVLRSLIQGAGDEPEWLKGRDGLGDWTKRGIKQAGLTGVPGLWMEKLPYGLAGPTVQQGVEAFIKDKTLGDSFEKSMPLNPIYRSWW